MNRRNVWFHARQWISRCRQPDGELLHRSGSKDVQKFFLNLPDVELAYFSEHTEHFDDYVEAVEWAQDYARRNRDLMMEQIAGAVRASGEVPPFTAELKAINCHHNY